MVEGDSQKVYLYQWGRSKERVSCKPPLVSRPLFQSLPLTESLQQTNVFVEGETASQGTWAMHMCRVAKCELLSPFKESRATKVSLMFFATILSIEK